MKYKQLAILTLTFACIFAFCFSSIFFFVGLTERSYEIGLWYENFLIYSSTIQIILIIIILFRQQWALYLYTIAAAVTYAAVYIYGPEKPYFSTILHGVIIVCLWGIFSEFKKIKRIPI